MSKRLPDITSADVPGPEGFDIDLSSTIEKPDLAIVTDADTNSPHVIEYSKDLAFMEDVLLIEVAPSADENAPDPMTCGVNGVTKIIPRGKPMRLARKFVDALIKTTFRTKTVNFKDKDGLDQTKIEQVPTANCTVQVYEDPAGEVGRRWLQHKMLNSY